MDDISGPDALEHLGPYFAVAASPGAGWRPLGDLVSTSASSLQVAHTRAALSRAAGAAVEERVAASTMSLGLFARLVSPVLAAELLGISLPRPSLRDTYWQPVERGPWPLALTGTPDTADLAHLLAEVVPTLVDALGVRHRLSRQVLGGNVTSALFGAVTVLAHTRPDLASAARARAAELLAGPLAGTGVLRPGFVRSSCCLYYRIPGAGYCGDCVLSR